MELSQEQLVCVTACIEVELGRRRFKGLVRQAVVWRFSLAEAEV